MYLMETSCKFADLEKKYLSYIDRQVENLTERDLNICNSLKKYFDFKEPVKQVKLVEVRVSVLSKLFVNVDKTKTAFCIGKMTNWLDVNQGVISLKQNIYDRLIKNRHVEKEWETNMITFKKSIIVKYNFKTHQLQPFSRIYCENVLNMYKDFECYDAMTEMPLLIEFKNFDEYINFFKNTHLNDF